MTETESVENMTTASSQESVIVPDPSGEGDNKPVVLKVPSYPAMIRRAILALKSKTGSSKRAILKHILANHETIKKKNAVEALDRNLKRMLKSGRLVKNNAGSYKISPRGHMAKVRQRRNALEKKKLAKLKKKKKRSSQNKLRKYVGATDKRTRSAADSKKKKIQKRQKPSTRKRRSEKTRRRKSNKTTDDDLD